MVKNWVLDAEMDGKGGGLELSRESSTAEMTVVAAAGKARAGAVSAPAA
jgi:hypothetical protein